MKHISSTTRFVPGLLHTLLSLIVVGSGTVANRLDAQTTASISSPTLSVSTYLGKVRLSWPKVPGAKSYRVYVASENETDFKLLVETKSTIYEAVMHGGTIQRYAVSGLDSKGKEGNRSDIFGAYAYVEPWGITAVPSGGFVVVDSSTSRPISLDQNARPLQYMLPSENHYTSYDVAVGPNGELAGVVWGNESHPLQGFYLTDAQRTKSTEFLAPTGKEPGKFSGPMGVGINSKGHVFVADTGNHRIQEFDEKGAFVQVIGKGDLRLPMKVTFDHKGDMFVADSGFNRIAVYSMETSGTWKLIRSMSDSLIREPCYVLLDQNDRVFVCTNRFAGIYMLGKDGKIAWTYKPADGDLITSPRGLALNSNGNITVVDSAARRIVTIVPPKP